jgi:hypothetical protein
MALNHPDGFYKKLTHMHGIANLKGIINSSLSFAMARRQAIFRQPICRAVSFFWFSLGIQTLFGPPCDCQME